MADAIDKSKLIVPGLAGIYDGLADYAYSLLRFSCGALLVTGGWVKIIGGSVAKYNEAGALIGGAAGYMAKLNFPIPEVLAWYVGILELVGGVMLAIGLLTRLVAIQVVVFMFVAAFVVHSQIAWFWTNRGMEMPLLWLAVAIVIFARGGGKWSVDGSMSKEF